MARKGNDSSISISSNIAESLSKGEREFFWGVELSEKNPAVELNKLPDEEDEEDTDYVNHVYFLKQAMLGSSATEGERHVVELESRSWTGETIKQPIFALTMGKTDQVFLDLNFGEFPATIRLIEGKGPLHITGQDCASLKSDGDVTMDQTGFEDESETDLRALPEEEESSEESSEEEEEEEDDDKVKKAKKRKAAQTTGKKAKRGKTEKVEVKAEDEAMEDSESGSEEETEEEEAVSPEPKKKPKRSGKAKDEGPAKNSKSGKGAKQGKKSQKKTKTK